MSNPTLFHDDYVHLSDKVHLLVVTVNLFPIV